MKVLFVLQYVQMDHTKAHDKAGQDQHPQRPSVIAEDVQHVAQEAGASARQDRQFVAVVRPHAVRCRHGNPTSERLIC